MIKALINALAGQGIEATASEVADALWLALHMRPSVPGRGADPGAALPEPSARPSGPSFEPQRPPEATAPRPPGGTTLQTEKGVSERRRSLLTAKAGGAARALGGAAIPIRAPAAQGLPGALELSRALRPLRRYALSSRSMVFDEEETVRRVAEEELWVPVMRPARTRWLDVALIVDEGASMCVWKQTGAEFRRLLERQGAFRDVRTWRLQTDAPDGEVRLYAGARLMARRPEELIDPTGRRLIVVLSDCVSPAWDGAQLQGMLEDWGHHGHVAIVQILPQRLWLQTALGEAEMLRVRPQAPGAPNTRLRKVGPPRDVDAGDGVPFPVVRLEPVPAGGWAKLVAGTAPAQCPAVVFRGKTSEGDEEEGWSSAAPPSAEERVRGFRMSASTTAYELALRLAAAPLTLPVMRLVQQALLPESRHEHLAEVLLGGLLCRAESDGGAVDPEAVEYNFHQGVRDLLLDAALVPDSLKVLRTVSEYIEQHFGQPLDFHALLLNPTVSGGAALGERNRAFAAVAVKVLRRLGGSYAQVADSIERGLLEDAAALGDLELFPTKQELIVPQGIKLLHTYRMHGGRPGEVAWSGDGRLLAVAHADGAIALWDVAQGARAQTLVGHRAKVTGLAWNPAAPGSVLASASEDGTINLWRAGERSAYFTRTVPCPDICGLAWMPAGDTLCWTSSNGCVYIWDVGPDALPAEVEPDTPDLTLGRVDHEVPLGISPKGRMLAVSSESGSRLFLLRPGEEVGRAGDLYCHSRILSLAWSPDGEVVAAGCADGSVRLWEVASGRLASVLEGHTGGVDSLSYTAGGRLLASMSTEGTVHLWRCDKNEVVAILGEQRPHFHIAGVVCHPRSPLLATRGRDDRAVRLWELDLDRLLGEVPVVSPVFYTTAKITLVGDSGVGKTGLGWRIAHSEFKDHPSTHGQQFWVIDELGATRADGTQCEAVLWDLAGQPDYRLVHALFLDDVDLALVLFDPTNMHEPLKGVEYWLKQLSREKRDGRQRRLILVGARADRGVPTLTREELEEFCRRQGIEAYVDTSALTGAGLDELLARVKSSIVWDEMPATVTTRTFKRVKEFVLALKEEPARRGVLVSPAELRARLEATDAGWEFTNAEMMTAVRHLSTHGYVSVLRGSSGEETILLAPDLLANLASSLVLEARRNPRGLGALEEARVLAGEYAFPELPRLEERERDVLLDAAVVLFIEHNLCFRETLGAQTLLIFPALINQKKPVIEVTETVDDYSYRITGAVENVYAALVVQLGYTNTFMRTNQWQNQAEYETARGEVCGFRQVNEREGEVELVLYYAKERASARLLFQGLFEGFLSARDVTVTKFPPVQCPKCGYWQQRTEVVKRIDEGRGFLFCGECGKKIALPKEGERVALSQAERRQLGREQEHTRRRTAFESALVRVKAVVRDEKKKVPSCLVSYAWGDERQERWVRGLAKDLENAGVKVILDRKDNPQLGANVTRFVNLIEQSDFVMVVGTPQYYLKYENKVSETGSVVAAEVDLINLRLTGTEEGKTTVLPLLLEGDDRESLPPLMRGKVYADLRRNEQYFPSLFDLVLTLYRIPFDHPAVDDLRDKLSIGTRGI